MRKLFTTALKVGPVALTGYALCSTDNQKSVDNSVSELAQFKGFKNRDDHLKDIDANPKFDLVVIGGGASGAGVCLDASTRGLRTLVIEANDFGSGTSSKSTKLIHGGVRYLEQVFAFSSDSLTSRIQKFKLVTQAIKQRGVLLRNAAYMNEKIPFVIPSQSSFASAYYYAGSMIYYLIYAFASEKNTIKFNFPYFLNRLELAQMFPYISDRYQSGVVYEDGAFNDARLLMTTLLTCTLKKEQYQYLPHGHMPANIVNKAEFVEFVKNQTGKIEGIVFVDKLSGKKYKVNAKYVANCTGTWSDKIRLADNPNAKKRICIVGGTHLAYDSRVSNHRFGLCIPSNDGRVMLVVPWLKGVIAGTTQKVFEQPQSNPKASRQQRIFIQTQMASLMQKIPADKLIEYEKSKWAGLRPLVLADQAKSTKDISRTHVIERSQSGLYSLMGGKWTTFRKMGADLVDQISKQQQKKNGKGFAGSISDNVLLFGSCSPLLEGSLQKQHGAMGKYLYKTYGAAALQILKGDLSKISGYLTRSQLSYIIKNEMVNQVQDLVMRRLRIALLCDRQTTLSLIPQFSRMLLEHKKPKYSEKQLQDLIKKNMEILISYDFN